MNLKKTRNQIGLTQRQLARELGLAKNGDVYIRKVENGRADPSGLLIMCLKYYLECRQLCGIKKGELLNYE